MCGGSEVECSHLKVPIVRNVVKLMGIAYKYTAIIWHEPLLGVNWWTLVHVHVTTNSVRGSYCYHHFERTPLLYNMRQ